MNKVSIFSLLVKDYDGAIQFYTQKVGFKLVEDKAFGESRWVTLALPESPDVTIALELAKNADDQALVGKQAAHDVLAARIAHGQRQLIADVEVMPRGECFADNDRRRVGEQQQEIARIGL